MPGQQRHSSGIWVNRTEPAIRLGKTSALRGSKKNSIVRIECWIQQLLDARHIDFSVFNERVIAMDQDRGRREKKEKAGRSWTGTD